MKRTLETIEKEDALKQELKKLESVRTRFRPSEPLSLILSSTFSSTFLSHLDVWKSPLFNSVWRAW
jgi:hypothetical protein